MKIKNTIIAALCVFCLPIGTSVAEIKIGVAIPESGPAGLFGPSTKNSAMLAAKDINDAGGINGEEIELLFVDAGLPPADVVPSVVKLWKGEGIEALVGMHDSAVRAAIQGRIGGQLPYVYTPVHAGIECQPGMYITGETPNQQLSPSIPYLMEKEGVSNWYLIGHDYSWPRNTNVVAKQVIADAGGSVVGEEYIPLGASEYDSSLRRIKESGADAILITIVGGGSVGFNKAFAGFGLDKQAIRLGTLMEENTLAGIGAGNTNRLYNAAGYFASLTHESAKAFANKYYETYGQDAAQLNGLGESAYEGLMLLAAIGNEAGSLEITEMDKVAEGIEFNSPRGAGRLEGRHTSQNIYLADGSSGEYEVIESFPPMKSSEACDI